MEDPALRHLTVSQALALEFFAVFSRFEYALKVTGFRSRGRTDEAMADWSCFARVLAPTFDSHSTPQMHQAFTYLCDQPARQLVVQGNELKWRCSQVQAASDVEKIVRVIGRVRNNLFHGGKGVPDPQSTPERDTQLVLASLVVLRELLRLSPEVYRNYED